jgi:GTP-binding protein HflX
MGDYYVTKKERETCVLIGVITKEQPEELLEEYLDELAFLAETAKAETLTRFTQKLAHPDPRTFVGSGKLEEIHQYVEANEVDIVIFDDELTPSQLRNIERTINPKEHTEHKVKILDRSNLILDIFAQRAQTAHAKTQVELAQYEYLLPRLTKMWTHLQKQKGGIGMKGPGEKEIETDRRIIRDRIAKLKDRIEHIDKQKATQRGNRGALVRVALVGYTNVGKSTLMNVLSKSDVFAENKLFATLDTTVRKVVLGNLPFLVADTVGFIRKLPHQLIESFKSTLDETREADILVHVLDISHSGFEEQYQIVQDTLTELETGDKPTITVFNKTDAYSPEEDEENENGLEALKTTWMSKIGNGDVVFISALNKENIEELRRVLYDNVKTIHAKRYPYNKYYY